jgi:hypothetical protein
MLYSLNHDTVAKYGVNKYSYKLQFKNTIFFNINPSGPIYSSETLVDFQQITWHCIPEYTIFHNHCSENLKY